MCICYFSCIGQNKNDSLFSIAHKVYVKMPVSSQVIKTSTFGSVHDQTIKNPYEYNFLEYISDSVQKFNSCQYNDLTKELLEKINKDITVNKQEEFKYEIFKKYCLNNWGGDNGHGIFRHSEQEKPTKFLGKYFYVDIYTTNHVEVDKRNRRLWDIPKCKKNVRAYSLMWQRYLLIDTILYEFIIVSRGSYRPTILNNPYRSNRYFHKKAVPKLRKAIHGDIKKQFDHFVNGIVIKEEEEEE